MLSYTQYLLKEINENFIFVDGKKRPRINSLGQPIYSTEEGIINFWKWFSDSKVVDNNGRPLVVYHGTRSENKDFEEFCSKKGNPCSGGGHYFTNSKELAKKFGYVREFYLKIINPKYDGFDGSGAVMVKSEYRDGGIFTKRKSDNYAKKGDIEFIVFNPSQIKSVNNKGIF